MNRWATVVAAVLMLALSVGCKAIKDQVLGKKGEATYKKLGIDPKNADADGLITAVEPLAKKWKKDAVWWAINIQKVRGDGTVDLTEGAGVSVTFISPKRLQSSSKKKRKDAMKKFAFGPKVVNYKKKIGTKKKWKQVVPPPRPTCTIKQIVKSLASRGLTKDKTVRVSFDPKFAYMAGPPSWRVVGKDPKLDLWINIADCSIVKEK